MVEKSNVKFGVLGFAVVLVLLVVGILWSSNLPSTTILIEGEGEQSTLIKPVFHSHRINREDWTLFTNFNGVTDLAIDQQGHIWSAGWGGAVRWDPETGAYTGYTIQNGLISNEIESIAASPDGTVWAFTRGYISQFKDEQWTAYEMPEPATWGNLAVAPNGDVWLGTIGPKGTGNGIYRFDGHAWAHFTWEQGLEAGMVDGIVVSTNGEVFAAQFGKTSRFDGQRWVKSSSYGTHCIAADADGSVWIHDDQSLIRFDGSELSTFRSPDGLKCGDIAVAPDGVVWISAEDKLARFDGEMWTMLPIVDALSGQSYWTNTIVTDDEGNLWLGNRQGLACFDGTTWQMYRTNKLAGIIQDITSASDGSVWLGTDRGLNRFDGQTWDNYTTVDGLGSDRIRCVAGTLDGFVWVVAGDRLSRFDGKRWTHFDQIDVQVANLAATSGSEVWLVNQSWYDVYRFDTRVLHSYASEFMGMIDIAVTEDGSVWFGDNDGIAHLKEDDWVYYFDYEEDFIIGDENWLYPGKDQYHIRFVVDNVSPAPDGTLWFSAQSDAGYLINFDGVDWKFYDLSGGKVDSLAVSADGEVWALVDFWNREEENIRVESQLVRFTDGEWRRYQFEGVKYLYGNKKVIASNGSIWITSDLGLMRIEIGELGLGSSALDESILSDGNPVEDE